MSALTEDQKQRFLDLTRRGWNRGAAATEIGATGTQLKRMINPTAHSYEADFASDYQQALAEVEPDGTAPNPEDTVPNPPRTTTLLGYTKAQHIPDDDVALFLEHVEKGLLPDLAASEIDTSLNQIYRRARQDKDFAQSFQAAQKAGYPIYQEWLRGMRVKQIEAGNASVLRDESIIHLPEAAVLRTSRHEIGGLDGGSLSVFVEQVIPNLPKEIVDEMIRRIEQGETPEQAALHA